MTCNEHNNKKKVSFVTNHKSYLHIRQYSYWQVEVFIHSSSLNTKNITILNSLYSSFIITKYKIQYWLEQKKSNIKEFNAFNWISSLRQQCVIIDLFTSSVQTLICQKIKRIYISRNIYVHISRKTLIIVLLRASLMSAWQKTIEKLPTSI
jgi:hypothetical protein